MRRKKMAEKDFGRINLMSLSLRGMNLSNFALEIDYKDYSIVIDKSSFQKNRSTDRGERKDLIMVGSIRVINPNGIDITRTFLQKEEISKTPSGDKIYATPENLLEIMKSIPISKEVRK
jgi:hypothetical protein